MNYGTLESKETVPPTSTQKMSEVDSIPASPARKYSIVVVVVVAIVSLVLLASNGMLSTSLRGFTSFRDIMTSESIYAPLQFQATTHYNLIPKFLEKYGLDGASEVSAADLEGSTASKGWLSVELFEKATCTGTSYGIGGVVLGQCMNVYGYEDKYWERSIEFDCLDSGSVLLKVYNESNCGTDYVATQIGTTGCKEPDDELYDEIYHSVQCSAAGALPLQGSFDLFKAYVGNKDVAIFEANPVSTCIQLIADHSFSFGHFNKEPNYLIYDSLDCSGQSSTESLEQDYTEFSDHEDDFPMDAEIVYTWEYYDSRSN